MGSENAVDIETIGADAQDDTESVTMEGENQLLVKKANPNIDQENHQSGSEEKTIQSGCDKSASQDPIDVPSSAAELAEVEKAMGVLPNSSISDSGSDDEEVPLTPVHFPMSSEIKQSIVLPAISLENGGLPENPAGNTENRAIVFDPFSVPSKAQLQSSHAKISAELGSTSAVELSLSCRDIGRRELFARNNLLVVVLGIGMVPGSWDELYRTEIVSDTRSPEFISKVRLPASSHQDRLTDYCVRVYNFIEGQSENIEDMECIGETKTTIYALMEATQMTLEKPVTSPRSGRVRGYISICLDIILHEEKVEQTTFDFGFTEDAPMVISYE